MDAKYYISIPERTGWYPIEVPDPPPPTLRIPLVRMQAEYIAPSGELPVYEASDIRLNLAYIEHWVSGHRVAVYL